MIWQNVWENAPNLLALHCTRSSSRMLDGVELEHTGHLQMERVVMYRHCDRHLPWCGSAARVDMGRWCTRDYQQRRRAKQVASGPSAT
jgi:hypothetical protein